MQATVLLVALVVGQPAQQPKDAEGWFKAMQAKVSAAKSVKVVVEVSLEGAAKIDGKMTATWTNDNQLNMDASSQAPGGQKDFDKVISDAKMAFTDTSKKAASRRDVEKTLTARFASLLLRAAVFTAVDEATTPGSQPKDEDLTLDKWKMGDAERIGRTAAQTIEYDCTIKNVPMALKIKLWINTDTMLPMKRTLVINPGGGAMEFRYTEIFSEFTINEKPDPKLFQLPR